MKVSTKKVAQAATAALLVTCYTTLVVLLQQQPSASSGQQNGVHLKTAGHGGGGGQNAATAARVMQRSPPRTILSENAVDYQVDSATPLPAADLYTRNASARTTELEDIFVSVKTTGSFHQNRLNVILKTWFVLARDQTYFFSDTDDPVYQSKTNGHLINTNCSSSHNRKALCCKMAVEFDTFLQSNKRWFCHFDDDNYVNVPRLVKLLQKYNPRQDWYLGKPSIRQPLEIFSSPKRKLSFWFATGGAGFCLSRALALKMMPVASGGKFISIGEKIRLPDDVTMGYIIEHLLKQRLTVVEEFHSHLELMRFLKADAYSEQITFSYSRFGREMNVLAIEGFDTRTDPTRFLSLHCQLFPNFNFCPR